LRKAAEVVGPKSDLEIMQFRRVQSSSLFASV
jgi:hypothetical protein